MWSQIDSRIRGMLQRIRLAFRGVLLRVNSAGSTQTVQLAGLRGETLQDAEFFQQYGLTSVPPAGTMAIVLPLNGQTSHSVIVATENARYRLRGLNSGEVALYTDEGTRIVLKRGKIVEVTCEEYIVNTRKYTVTTERFDVTASGGADFDTPLLKASDEITDGTGTMGRIREIYDSHDHDYNGDHGTTHKPNQPM
jgi:phage baseplate assembly protein V